MLKALLVTLMMMISSTLSASSWNSEEKQLLLTASVLHIIDWRQTQGIVKNPERFYEMNPLLGKHPTMREVNLYFLTTGILLGTTANYIPQWRKTLLMTYVSVQTINTIRNYHVGLRVE